MSANIDEILSKPAFDKIEPERKEEFKKFYTKVEGKSTMEILPHIVSFMANMPKEMDFSQEEKVLMMETVLENLSEEEKLKFGNMVKMFNVM